MLTLADIRSQYPGADALSDDELIGVTAERYGTTPDVFKEAIGYQPPKVEPTGVMDEIGRGLIHGAKVTLPKAVGEAAQFFGADEFGSKMVQDANAREAADNQESAYGRSLDSPYSPRGNVYEAADNSVLSVAPGAAGAAIGAGVGAFFGGIGAGPGALIGYGIGSLASLPIFYGSQGQSSSDRIREAQLKAGATPEQADSEARIGGHQAGAIEAGGELVADIIPFDKMFKPFAKPAAKAAGTLVKDLFFPTVGRGLKTVGQTVAGEVVTEMGQQAGEDAVEGAHGAGEGATWDSTSRVIMPTALMSLIPGMAGAASKHAQVNASRKALESPDTPQNVRAGLAAAAVHEMSGISQDTAKAFSLYAGKQIEAGQPIKFEGDDFYKAAKAAPAEEKPAGILQLANTSDPMVGFPDGTVWRRADVDRYINSLPEDQRVSARSKLYGFGPEQAINAIGAAASVDEAIAAANAAVSAPTTLTGQDRATLMTPPENIMGAVYERQAQTAADQADLDAFVQSETRDLNTLRAQTIENMRKQREMDQIQSAGTGQYGVRPEQRAAVADAATVDAPTAMQLAMQRATRKSDPTAQTESPPTAAQLPSASAVGAAQQTQTLAPGSDALRPPTLAKGQDAGSGQTVLASQNDTSQPDILPTDIARLDGKPFQTANGARLKQREAGGIEGSDIVPVSGGFVVRPKVSQPQEQVSAKSQETVESTSGRPAPVGPAIDAGAATGHAAPAVEPAANGAVVQVDNAQSNAGSLTVPQKLQVTFGGKTYPVDSIDDAQRKWIKFQEAADGGGPVGVSKVGNGVQITDQNGKFVARISFNGRVWNGEGDDAKVIAEAPRPAPDQRLVPVSKRVPIGAGVMVQRQQNAGDRFVESAMEQFGMSKPDAEAALARLVKDKVVKLDPIGGQYSLKDGRFWDKEVLARAAQPTAPDPRIGTQDLTDDEATAEFERLYQEDVKADIRQRLGLEPKAKDADAKQSPFRTFLRQYGISTQHASDITGERGFRANNRLPATSRRNGRNLDELAELAVERGFLTQAEVDSKDDNGGTDRLLEMIRAELRGERQVSNEMADEVAGDDLARVRRMELDDMADALGLPYDKSLSEDRLASMVSRVQKTLDASREPKGSLKADRVRANAIAAAKRIEAKREQFERELEQFAKATIVEQNAVLEVLMDEDGMPALVNK